MNVIFHLASALGAVVLVLLLLRVQRQRDLLRYLMASQRPRASRVYVEAPAAFLARFAQALDIPFEGEGAARAPRRIGAGPLADLFLRSGITLVRCKDEPTGELTVELTGLAPGSAALEAALAGSLGEDVRVRLVPQGSGHVHSSGLPPA